MLSIIVAMSSNHVIGKAGKLPWHLSEDLKHFKEITMGHIIVMGRKTYESIGKPLPGRQNVVVTRQKDFCPDGVRVINSLDEITQNAPHSPQHVFIIGGSDIYQQALPYARRLYITLIHKKCDGDTYFPQIDLERDYKIAEKSGMLYSEKENLPYQFIVAEKL